MMWTGWWSLVWTFAWLCTTAAQGPTANATVAMLLDLEVTSGLYAALRRHAGRLSVRYNVNITLDLYHVNDTLSTIQSTAQASQHAEVIVGTGCSKLTSSMVTYLSELPNKIPAISFIPGSEKYVLCGPRDIMLVSTTSETSRWQATVNFGDYYHWMHWVIVTDNANMAVLEVLPRCTADNSKHSCIIGVVFVCMSDTSAEVYEKLTLLNTTNATLFYFDLKDDWLPRLVEWFPLWLADRPEFIYIVSLSPSSMTDLWTTLSVWETAGAQIWYDREIVIVAPYIQEWVRNSYGVYAGLYYALAMECQR